jgi:predicted 3-demethylubiquinone-9 3-methyltransferase (glyoxalase superfamily)
MTDDTVIVNIQPEDSVQLSFSNSAITSVNGYIGDITLSKSDIGLDQVDNTSDANKPLSDATTQALSLKADQTEFDNIYSYVNSTSSNFSTITNLVSAKYHNWDYVYNLIPQRYGNVDNTSDLNKPVSNATKQILSLKADLSAIGDNVILKDQYGVPWKLQVDFLGNVYTTQVQ